jgi:hypothetical protein
MLKRFTILALLAAASGAQAAAAEGAGSPATLTRAIEAAVNDPAMPFRLQVDCSDEEGIRSLTVYRGRVAVFNHARQALLGRDQRNLLLGKLLEAGYPGFAESYGGRRKAAKEEAALKVTCRVVLDVAGRHKSSVQLLQGEQSAELLGLADELLDAVAPLAVDGVGARSLDDGLAKLARGELAPEVLELRLVSLPPEPASAEGFILRIEGGEISRQAYAPGRLVGPVTKRAIAACQSREIVDALLEAGVSELPLNLRGAGATELAVGVLGQDKTVLSRPGFPPGREEQQDAFATLVTRLASQPSDCSPAR